MSLPGPMLDQETNRGPHVKTSVSAPGVQNHVCNADASKAKDVIKRKSSNHGSFWQTDQK